MTPHPVPGGWAWPGEATAARWLKELGLTAGMRVLLGPDHTPATAICIAAALRLGLVIELVPRRCAPSTLPAVISASPAARIIAATTHLLIGIPGTVPLPTAWEPVLPRAATPWRGSLVLHTSGTSGQPRRVHLAATNIAAALTAQCTALALTPHDQWSNPLPLDHIGGVMTCLRSLASGCTVWLEPTPRNTATGWSGVPTQLYRLLETATPPPPHLRLALIGGGPLDPCLAVRAQAARWPVAESYAMSEMSGTVAINGHPLPGVHIRLEEDGRILLAGAMRCAGYENDGILIRSEDWHRTDDYGRWEDGRLRILGRVAERIVSGGEKIDANAVEAVLRAHPAIADAAVLGLPDPEWGERLAAIVVCRTPVAIADLKAWLAPRLPRPHWPRQWRTLPALPRNELGKLQRTQLATRWCEARDAIDEVLQPLTTTTHS